MNANAVHNILNIIFGITGVWIMFDWQVFGVDPATAAKIAGGLMLTQNTVKVLMNIGRDGVDGMFKVQPPVEK